MMMQDTTDNTSPPTNSPNGQPAKEKRIGSDDNIIYVGAKPLVNYIKGVMTQFQRKNASEVVIKSRGKFIAKAVEEVKQSISQKAV